jgi:hypothetical protein
MATELTVILDDRPGTLADFASLLGGAGVNIEAIMGSTHDGRAVVRFVPRDVERAIRALGAAAITCTPREVVIVRVLDEPGTLAQVALTMANAGINIEAVYVTTRGHLVLSVDDVDGAMQVATGLAVVTFD